MPISRQDVKYFNAIVKTAARTVLDSDVKHKFGELTHYFDRIWIVTGHGQDRVVCHQQDDTCTLTILQQFPDLEVTVRMPCIANFSIS